MADSGGRGLGQLPLKNVCGATLNGASLIQHKCAPFKAYRRITGEIKKYSNPNVIKLFQSLCR